MTMGGLAVKRYGGNYGGDPTHHISLLSLQDLSVRETFQLPFDKDEPVDGGSCDGFVYFRSDKGTIVICNLTTKELKFLPPPEFLPPPHSGYLDATGLGYDAESKDYKLLRSYVQCFNGEADRYGGYETHFEVYSLKDESWKKIPDPEISVGNCVAVYVRELGRCYWKAALGAKYFDGGLSNSNAMRMNVVSFDFATESFDCFPYPDNSFGAEAHCKLVECRGSLGALVYTEGCYNVEIYVRRGNLWEIISRASIPRFDTPLFLKNDRFLFFEARGRRRDGGLRRLMVCDLDEVKLEDLGITDFPESMSVVSYVESPDALTNSEPMSIYDSKPISSEDGDETSGWALKNLPGSKTRRARKTKTKGTT